MKSMSCINRLILKIVREREEQSVILYQERVISWMNYSDMQKIYSWKICDRRKIRLFHARSYLVNQKFYVDSVERNMSY